MKTMKNYFKLGLILMPLLLIAIMVSCKNPVTSPKQAAPTTVVNTPTITHTSTQVINTPTRTCTSTQVINTRTYTSTVTSTLTATSTATATATATTTATTTATVTSWPVIVLGAASTFGAFGYAGVTNVDDGGTLTDIKGDLGSYGALSTITGFPQVQVHGTIWGMDSVSSIVTTVFDNATTAYNNLAGLPVTQLADPGAELGTQTLAPGTYKTASGAFSIIAGNLTLDSTDPNAVWVFKMDTTLTVGDSTAPRSIILLHQAQAKNVYWQVGSAADINLAGLGGTMVGTIIANAAIRFSVSGSTTPTVLNGRALSLGAAVTMITTDITVPQ